MTGASRPTHRIRLRGPWKRTAAKRPASASASQGLQRPFGRPTGLHECSNVFLEVADELPWQTICCNDVELATSAARAPGPWPIGNLLQPRNLLEIELPAGADPARWQRQLQQHDLVRLVIAE